jgi:hypothetical protein
MEKSAAKKNKNKKPTGAVIVSKLGNFVEPGSGDTSNTNLSGNKRPGLKQLTGEREFQERAVATGLMQQVFEELRGADEAGDEISMC